jgi:hypothetical protein
MPFSCHRTMRLVIAAAGVIIAIFLRFVTGLSREGWLAIDLVNAVVLIGLGGWLSRRPIREWIASPRPCSTPAAFRHHPYGRST